MRRDACRAMKRAVFVALLLFARDGIQRVMSGGRQGRRVERVRASQELHPRPTRDARSWKRNCMVADGNGGRGLEEE